MLVLGIETSCDDTSAALVEDRTVLSNLVASQDALHADYGGVVPELAARRHLETVQTVIERALELGDRQLDEIDVVAVTRGPGLVGSLLVGLSAAQGLALALDRPLYGVNHLEGHVLSPLVEGQDDFPLLSVLVSGGHTAMYLVEDVGVYRELSRTRDDSAGEAFDKGAKMLDLGWPGGKVMDELGSRGDPTALRFPRPRVRDDSLAFSFSGLKTSLWDFLHSDDSKGHSLEDVCASYQEAIVDCLLKRVGEAVERFAPASVAVAGGVSANSRLRRRLTEELSQRGMTPLFPSLSLCTDNAAMIAYAAVRRMENGLPGEQLEAVSRLPLGSVQ